MRWVFIGCPCALGSLSSQPHTPLSRLVPFSCLHSFVLLRAHLHFALPLALLASPRGGVCVCVTLGIIGILSDCFSFTVVFLVQGTPRSLKFLTCLETNYNSLIETKYTSLIGILDMLGDEVHLVDWNSCHACLSFSLPLSLSLSLSLLSRDKFIYNSLFTLSYCSCTIARCCTMHLGSRP